MPTKSFMSVPFPTRRRLKFLANVILALVIVYSVLETDLFWLEEDTAVRNDAAAGRRVSTLDCKHSQRTCLISNLHLRDGQFYVYMGKGFNASGLEEIAMFTGIGWGTGYFRFHYPQLGPWPGDTLRSIATSHSVPNGTREDPIDEDSDLPATRGNLSEASVGKPAGQKSPRRFSIAIHVISDVPPESSDAHDNSVFIKEPTVIFSVLWPNLFRTMYAAYAAWYTQLEYKIFFPGHHRAFLIDRSPAPYRFLSIIQSVTPTPVMRAEELLEGSFVFSAAVVGLSRDAL
ncbi:hypothetical protein HDU84_007224, partial [Entophlyctis sp. JEL0112]